MSALASMMVLTGALAGVANEWSSLSYKANYTWNTRQTPNNSFQTGSLNIGTSSDLPPSGYDRLVIVQQNTLNWLTDDVTGGSAAQWNGSTMTKLAEYENTSGYDTTNAFFAIVDNTSTGSQTYGFQRNNVAGAGWVGTAWCWTVLLPSGGTYSVGTAVNQSTTSASISLTAPSGYNSPDLTTLYMYGVMTRNGSQISSISSNSVNYLAGSVDAYTTEWNASGGAINPGSASWTATMGSSAAERTDLLMVLKLN